MADAKRFQTGDRAPVHVSRPTAAGLGRRRQLRGEGRRAAPPACLHLGRWHRNRQRLEDGRDLDAGAGSRRHTRAHGTVGVPARGREQLSGRGLRLAEIRRGPGASGWRAVAGSMHEYRRGERIRPDHWLTVLAGHLQRSAIRHFSHNGRRATETERPCRISPWWAWSLYLAGTTSSSFISTSNGVLPVAMPVRLPTRKMWVSTAMVGSPKATLSTTLAVLRPTPGSASSASRVRGTAPPCSLTSCCDRATTFFALVR